MEKQLASRGHEGFGSEIQNRIMTGCNGMGGARLSYRHAPL